MEIKYLRLIKAIAEEGSISKATDKLYLSQSALSHQLRSIEDSLGTSIFLRVGKKLFLTESGRILLTTANNILNELDRASSELAKTKNGRIGKIRLCTECYTCYHWLPAILKSYSLAYPNVEIILNTDERNNPIDQLINGKLDIAIIHRQKQNIDVDYIDLFHDELVLVVSSTHKLAKKKYVYAKDFAGVTLFSHNKNYKKSSIFERVLGPAGIRPKKVVYMQITETVIEMVKAGFGVAVMAKWAMKPYLEKKKITVIPITRIGLWRAWKIATLNYNPEPEYLTYFINQLREKIRI